MCEPATIGYTAAALVGGYLASRQVGKAQAAAQQQQAGQKDPTTPPPPTPVTPPPVSVNATTPVQKTRAPNVQALRQANAGAKTGRDASSASTLLTGPTGIDLSQLNIGRNTLLGS